MPRYTASKKIFLNGYILGHQLDRSLIMESGDVLDYDSVNKEIRFQGVLCQADLTDLINNGLTASGNSPLFDASSGSNAYSPSNPSDWSPAPTDVDSALDQLAGNLVNVSDDLGSVINDLNSAVNDLSNTTTTANDALNLATNVETTVSDLDVSVAKFYVSDALGDDINGNGSFSKPFKTVQKALDSLTGGLAALILLSNGDYSGNLTISRDNVLIQAYGTTDSHQARILGTVTITSGVTRFKMKDVKVSVTSSISDVALTFQSTQGRHYFDNVTFENTNGTSAEVVVFSGVNNRWVEFNNCSFSGIVNIGGTPAVNSSVRFRNVDSYDTQITISNDNWLVTILNAPRLGKITHSAGKIYANGIYSITSAADSYAISSSANAPNGFLWLNNVNFQQPNLSYKGISKTGNCNWELNLCNYDPTQNLFLGGSRVAYLSRAVDILAGYVPSNYNPGDIDVISHLVAIDNKFGDINNTAQFITAGDLASRPGSPDVGFMYFATDSGTNGQPIWFNGTDWVDAASNIIP